MLNLEAVNGYVFIPARDYIDQNPEDENVNDFKMHGDRIELIIGGTPYVFRGEEAKEIYDMLSGNTVKSVLKG